MGEDGQSHPFFYTIFCLWGSRAASYGEENMYHTIFEDKPTCCVTCPLKDSFTHECGKIEVNRSSSSSVNYYKVPDKRCKIKQYVGKVLSKKIKQ